LAVASCRLGLRSSAPNPTYHQHLPSREHEETGFAQHGAYKGRVAPASTVFWPCGRIATYRHNVAATPLAQFGTKPQRLEFSVSLHQPWDGFKGFPACHLPQRREASTGRSSPEPQRPSLAQSDLFVDWGSGIQGVDISLNIAFRFGCVSCTRYSVNNWVPFCQ